MKKRIPNYCVLIFLSLCLFSCSEKKEVFSEFQSFRDGSWSREEPAVFTINVNDTITQHHLNLIIRHNDDYTFQNLWLFIDLKNPEGFISSDSLNIELADVYGKWHGRGLSIYNLKVPYSTELQYPASGDYTYIVRQGMRENPLKGITDIGLVLSK